MHCAIGAGCSCSIALDATNFKHHIVRGSLAQDVSVGGLLLLFSLAHSLWMLAFYMSRWA